MNLVIVESPAKAKTINKMLGKDYEVRACMGHVRDLPQRSLGVDLENGFRPEYVTISSRKKVLGELKAAAKRADAIYLAPDPDREGEAIAWHLRELLANAVPEDRFYRVTYNEITPPAIREAFEHPSRLDMARVDAQQARRVLDRIVGYQVSPLLWRRIRGSKSAGRVQSVALRLVCEREREIQAFVPQEYWLMGARVRKQTDPRDPFAIRLARIGDEKAEIQGQARMEAVRDDLVGRTLVVTGIIERELTRKAQAPFITSTLQQAGSSAFGFAPSRTMRLAQTLYEGVDFGDGAEGLITYMRTDSVAISAGARDACREFVRTQYGEEYLPEKPAAYASRGGAQEAHEAIRPTDMRLTPDALASVLKPDELRLYRLIWNRFVASQMAPARIAQRTVEIDARAADSQARRYLFRATTSEIAFPGYMKVTGADARRKNGNGDANGEEVEGLPPSPRAKPSIAWNGCRNRSSPSRPLASPRPPSCGHWKKTASAGRVPTPRSSPPS
jgi:DNA topoisomerase I